MKHFSLMLLLAFSTAIAAAQDSHAGKRRLEIAVLEQFKQFIDAENIKDTIAVKKMLWQSPDMVFAPFGKRDSTVYNGYWGADNAMRHFNFLYKLGIHLEPDYVHERVALLGDHVAEVFIPAKISFPDRAPLPFLVMTYWLKEKDGWKLATDIAVPVGS